MAEGISSIDGYLQSDTDTSSTSPQYFGYQAGNGAYYVMQVITSNGVSTFRYYASGGRAQYITDWTNRIGLVYDYYANVFKNT